MNTDRIAAPLRHAVESGALACVAGAAATRDGVVFAEGFGTAEPADGVAMRADTVVWIASMTKAITGACAMQLVEQGRLALDDDLAPLLPALGRVQVLDGFDEQGRPRLRPKRGAITLRRLLTHSSGFTYDIWNADMLRYQELTGTPGIISCAEAALTVPLAFDPGARWEYGIGIDWAGRAVEAVAGMRLEEYMRRHLFDPLGMADTGFVLNEGRRRLARMQMRTPEGGLTPIDFMIPQQPEFFMGGGGLYGTVSDYLRFARMVLGGGELDGARVLKPETVALMARNAMGDLRCRPLRAAIAPSSNDVPFVEGMQWGLSFMINPEPLPTGRAAGSLAWAGLANSYYWIDAARGVCGVYATQVLPFFDAKSVAAFEGFERAVYATVGK